MIQLYLRYIQIGSVWCLAYESWKATFNCILIYDVRYNPCQGARFWTIGIRIILAPFFFFGWTLAKVYHFGTHNSETISLIFSNFRKPLEFVSFHMVGFYFIFDNNMVALGCFLFIYCSFKV